MSGSEHDSSRTADAPPQATVLVRSDPDAEVFLIDGTLRLAARGIGGLEAEVPMGLYKIKVVRGDTIREELINVDTPRLSKDLRVEIRPAVAPAAGEPPRIRPSISLNQVVTDILAEGARLFLPPLVQAIAGPGYGMPSGRTGTILFVVQHAEGATDRALQKVHLMPWGGAAQARSLATLVELKPVDDPSATVSAGALQVSAELPSILEMETAAAPIRIVLPVHPRWQTRVFLRQRASIRRPGRGLLSLPGYEVDLQLAEAYAPIADPEAAETRQIALTALSKGRRIMSTPDHLDRLFRFKWRDPLLGIAGLHLLLNSLDAANKARETDAPEPVPPRLQALVDRNVVIDNLQKLLHDDLTGTLNADLAALKLRVDPDAEVGPIATPPVFWRSWAALSEANSRGRAVLEAELWRRVRLSSAVGPYFGWTPHRKGDGELLLDTLTQFAGVAGPLLKTIDVESTARDLGVPAQLIDKVKTLVKPRE